MLWYTYVTFSWVKLIQEINLPRAFFISWFWTKYKVYTFSLIFEPEQKGYTKCDVNIKGHEAVPETL